MKYFIMKDGEQRGPYELHELHDAGVYPDTYVWCKGMDDWQKAEDVADICRYWRQRLIGVPGERILEQRNAEEEHAEKQRQQLEEFPERFRRQVHQSGTDFSPIEQPQQSYDVPPKSWLAESIIAACLCCPLTGFIAIFFAASSRRAWKKDLREESYNYARQARMWVGITFFFGMILAGFTLSLVP